MICSICKINFSAGYLCKSCKGLSYCSQCYERAEHPHEMRSIASVLPLPRDQIIRAASEQPVRHFIQGLSRVYCTVTGSQHGACQYIFSHMLKTNLSCNCIVCKHMSAIFENHLKKCQIPGCSFMNCPLITELLEKRKTAIRNSMTGPDAIQKLMEIRMAIETAQASSSQITSSAAQEITGAARPALTHRRFAIQRCIRTLEHAYRCTDVNCMPVSCQKMKRVLAHIKICKRKISGGCVVCKQVCALCCYHAKNCNERKCSVLLCSYIKRKIRAINAVTK